MVTGKNTKRLSKVAREFNIGISTIVEFLEKKGLRLLLIRIRKYRMRHTT